jgi:hypothetical protein
MKTYDVESWEEFISKLNLLQEERDQRANNSKISVSQLLFRGQGNSEWELKTTLERAGKVNVSLLEYYKLISRTQPQIETFTGQRWKTPTVPRFENWLAKNDSIMGLLSHPAYEYLVYLRHHGFPSPLLDWTQSPFVAAYFAFHRPNDSAKNVSIYAFWERPRNMKIGSPDTPEIVRLGPYVRSHKRHFLQQSEYTVCQVRKEDWRYAPHEKVFERGTENQDLLWKFNIPVEERIKVLEFLDAYNLNAFSLFGSEESLMETMALRELHFKEEI